MAHVRRVLERAADDVEWRYQGRDPVVYMTQFGASSVDFEVSVWTDNAWERQRRLSELHEAIWWALKEADITIAFPQIDVHLDAAALAALAVRSEGEKEDE